VHLHRGGALTLSRFASRANLPHTGGVDRRPRAESDAPDLAELVRQWGVGSLLDARQPETGTVNQTVLLTTERGRFVLRGYRHLDPVPIEREHAVIAHVRERGLPAVAPLPLSGGGAVHERDGRYYSLFPWAAGRQVRRADVGPAEAAAIGACLARLHSALATFPVDRVPVPRRSMSFSRGATLAAMDELEARMRAVLGADPLAPTALTRLSGQRAYLERLPECELGPGAGSLPDQVIHGDYQEANLFFVGGAVTAIIDWDQTHLAPRASEVIRVFGLVFDFEPERCRRFVRAYRAAQPLALDELDAAAAANDARASHSLWVYEELYVRGNRRVARFIEGSDRFVPISAGWARVRNACALEAMRTTVDR
jgi:Ser/Thr protein kinase RdoA (MazF antagonist)